MVDIKNPTLNEWCNELNLNAQLNSLILILSLAFYFSEMKLYLLQDSDAAAGDDNCHHAGNNMTLVIMMLYT